MCGRFQKRLGVETGLRESYSREKGGVQSSFYVMGIIRIKAQEHTILTPPPPPAPRLWSAPKSYETAILPHHLPPWPKSPQPSLSSQVR